MPCYCYVPTGLLISHGAFYIYPHLIPNGIVPEGQNVGRKKVDPFCYKVPEGRNINFVGH